MFSAMRQGSRFIDVCLRFNPVSINIDERNLVLYGLANGYIRQLRKVNYIFYLIFITHKKYGNSCLLGTYIIKLIQSRY